MVVSFWVIPAIGRAAFGQNLRGRDVLGELFGVVLDELFGPCRFDLIDVL